MGHPIVGDKLYQMGDAWFDAFTRRALTPAEQALLPCPRQCLHAASVELDGATFAAPFPSALLDAVSGAPSMP